MQKIEHFGNKHLNFTENKVIERFTPSGSPSVTYSTPTPTSIPTSIPTPILRPTYSTPATTQSTPPAPVITQPTPVITPPTPLSTYATSPMCYGSGNGNQGDANEHANSNVDTCICTGNNRYKHSGNNTINGVATKVAWCTNISTS